jgi:ACS family glucarate transporter-like MFS transporter
MGWLLSAFLLGYALLQIPGGWACDRFGGRKVLCGAVLGWSIFTALTGLAPRLPLAGWVGVAWSFAIVRFLVGVGEAASSPSMNKIVTAWTGPGERGMGASFSILGIGAGGAATPIVIAWIMQRWGWCSSFYLASIVGAASAIAWFWYVRDRPEEHPGVNPAELEHLRGAAQSARVRKNRPKTPWKLMLTSASVWGLMLGYFCQGFPIYFFHTWFFIYLVNIRGLSITRGSFFGSMPYIAIVVLAPIGGAFSDFACRRLGKRRGRRLAVCVGMILSAVLLWTGSRTANNFGAILQLGAGAGFNMFAATTYWATCIDLSAEFTASLSALMNTFGNLGGWLSPIVTAYLATHYGWTRALLCASLVTLASAFCALLIRADQSLDPPSLSSS